MTDSTRSIIRKMAGLIMGLLGISIYAISYNYSGTIAGLVQGLSISFIITGVVTVFQEFVLLPLQKDETRRQVDRIAISLDENFNRVFTLMRGPGIEMLSPERRGNMRYYTWFLEHSPQQMYFAGHSILHRIQADFTDQGFVPVYEAFRQKAEEGSKIQILFLDPTWNFIEKIAEGQKQDPNDLRRDLCTTLGICKKLWQNLEANRYSGEIEIHTCSELNQYAIHNVICREKSENEMLVGFYFAGKLGMRSPLFLIGSQQIQEIFIEHFNSVFDRGKTLLRYSRGNGTFDHAYYRACVDHLSNFLTEKEISDLCL